MERNTSQKQIIINYLKSVKTHPTAEEVYNEVVKILPSISKGTVYRILNNFKEKSLVQEISSNITHYDADISEHAHLICKECKRVSDVFDYSSNDKLPEKVQMGQVDSRQVIFHGTCNACL